MPDFNVNFENFSVVLEEGSLMWFHKSSLHILWHNATLWYFVIGFFGFCMRHFSKSFHVRYNTCSIAFMFPYYIQHMWNIKRKLISMKYLSKIIAAWKEIRIVKFYKKNFLIFYEYQSVASPSFFNSV